MDLWDPFWLSIRIAAFATVATLLIAVPGAYFVSRRRIPGTTIIEALLTLPLVLPPTVVGFVIIMALGAQGWPGRWLMREFGYSIIFRFEGAVLAATIVSLPLLYIPARAAFASVDREMEEFAILHGANAWQVFWYVDVPLARRGLFSGTLLAFTRALGEFGATIMVFGWQAQHVTLPISIYADFTNGPLSHATGAVLLLIFISLLMLGAYNLSSLGQRE